MYEKQRRVMVECQHLHTRIDIDRVVVCEVCKAVVWRPSPKSVEPAHVSEEDEVW